MIKSFTLKDLPKPSPEEMDENRKKTLDRIARWKKFELEHPELAKTMTMTMMVKGMIK